MYWFFKTSKLSKAHSLKTVTFTFTYFKNVNLDHYHPNDLSQTKLWQLGGQNVRDSQYLHRVGDILYIIKTVGSRTWVVGTHFLDLKLGLLIRRLLQISAINVASTFRKKLLSNLGFIEHLSYARAWIDVN